MTGTVAIVLGLCALSFAAGCVLTAVMLKRGEAEPEAGAAVAQGPAPEEPEPPEPRSGPAGEPAGDRLELRWPEDDFATRPIFRNPVVGLPVRPAPALAREDAREPEGAAGVAVEAGAEVNAEVNAEAAAEAAAGQPLEPAPGPPPESAAEPAPEPLAPEWKIAREGRPSAS